jgi:hypothetical protein
MWLNQSECTKCEMELHDVTSNDDTFEDLDIPTTNQLQFVQPITQSITQPQ